MLHDFNQQIIEEFRNNHGHVNLPLRGGRLLLLTTTGISSGASHTTPLGYIPDRDRKLVIASNGGAPAHPSWYHNLLAHPQVLVEDGVFTYRADAVVLEGEERDRLFDRAAEADPGWAEDQAMTSRVFPVVALSRTSNGMPRGPLGDSLKAVHDGFRRELALLRKEIAKSGPGLLTQLRVNCLSMCITLQHHHEGEDDRMFAFLDMAHPEVGPVVTRLREEHREFQRLLEELQKLVSADHADQAAVLAGVERVTAELETHLDYEERELLSILNTVIL